MTNFEEICKITNEMYIYLTENLDKDRDTQIEKVNHFLDLREQILNNIDSTKIEKVDTIKLEKLNNQNVKIESILQTMKNAIHQDIFKSKESKKAHLGYQQQAYVPSFDGYFFDKKN